MKKFFFIWAFLIIASCASQNKYRNFDYSYSRSGGKEAIYENLIIKENNVHYSFEGKGEIIKKDFKLSNLFILEIIF